MTTAVTSLHRDPGLGQDVGQVAGLDAVVGIELVVAEPEPGVEQQHSAAMANRIRDDHAGLTSMGLVDSEPKLAKNQRNDVSRQTATVRQLRYGGRWQGGAEHRSERT